MKMVVTMQGTTPLVMHNSRLADSMDEITKAIKELTSQRRKTEEIERQISELEFKGSLYINSNGPFVSAEAIRKTWIFGAKLSKLGPSVQRGVTMLQMEYPLIYDGPRTPDELWNDKRFVWRSQVVVSGRGRVTRTRAQFPQWALEVAVGLDNNMLNSKDFERIVSDSGLYIGLLEARGIGRGRFLANVEAAAGKAAA